MVSQHKFRGGKVIFDVTLGGAKGFLTNYQSLYGKNIAKNLACFACIYQYFTENVLLNHQDA